MDALLLANAEKELARAKPSVVPGHVPGHVSGHAPGHVPGDVARRIAGGTSALGAGVLVERGLGFAANVLAARLGGTRTFGAYSLAVATAVSISTYAAGGIGATAARFSGKYPRGSARYPAFAWALLTVSLVSALLAALALACGASPIAHLLGKPGLTPLLRWAALSSAGVLLLECARGFFVGQHRLRALLLLSLLAGAGLLLLLPWAASSHRPARMVVAQGLVTTGAVLVSLLLARPLGLLAPPSPSPAAGGEGQVLPLVKEVWSFGLVQLAGLAGINLAGWWIVSLVARADTTLVQMSYFAVASQLRNIAGLAPGLLTEGSYAVMGEVMGEGETQGQARGKEQEAPRTPDQVMAFCTFLSMSASLLLASAGIMLLPWGLGLVYGSSYAGAALPASVALAIAVVHMGNAPAAARLSIVSIRTTAAINTMWAVFVGGAGALFLLRGGNAAAAMLVFLTGHILSACLVLLSLGRAGHVPAGMAGISGSGIAGAAALVALSFLRSRPGAHLLPWTLAMGAVAALCTTALVSAGRHWLPDRAAYGRLGRSLRARLASYRTAERSERSNDGA